MPTEPTDRVEHLHTFAVLVAVLLAVGHVYLALFVESVGTTASNRFLAVGTLFLAGAAVSLTRYFRPMLYPFGALYAAFLGVLWLLGGMKYFRYGLLMGALGTTFVVLTTYLFVRSEEGVAGE